jgi:DNA-binding CsgD family transcriptional regulator/DNA-binding MarR family transcriptional regulator
VLNGLGLGEDESAVYGYLLETKPATAADVRAGTGLQEPRASRALAGLEHAGFVHRAPGDANRYTAALPGAVDAAILRKLADLREAQERISQFAARYRATRLETEGIGVFEIIRGVDAVRERTGALLASARTETLNMVKPPVIAIHVTEPGAPGDAVRGRIVLDRDLIRNPGTLEAIRQTPGTDYEIRVHTLVPVKMLAVDRKTAMLPLGEQGGSPATVLLAESALLDSVLSLFSYVWETAVTLHHAGLEDREEKRPGRSPLTPENRRLLSLLLAGMTDQAIAGHYRVSVRTIERRIRAMMDAAQVRTRTQLAWEAARRQWL